MLKKIIFFYILINFNFLKMTKYNHIALSYLFTSKVLSDLFNGNNCNKIIKIFKEFDMQNILNQNITLRELFDDSYKKLVKNYRNEYIFKNAIAQKILIGRHSIKSSTLLTEFRVETSKADVVIFNGTSYVYEIKTDLDNFERLEDQIKNYKKVFEYVNVVLNEPKNGDNKKINTVKQLIDDDIGIIVLTDKYTLKTIRKAKSGLDSLDKEAMFNILRKNEYLKIIKDFIGHIPDVPNTQIYTICKELFITLSIEIIHKEVLKTLKNRKNYKSLINSIKDFPNSLKIAILEFNLTTKQQQKFKQLLDTKINQVFV